MTSWLRVRPPGMSRVVTVRSVPSRVTVVAADDTGTPGLPPLSQLFALFQLVLDAPVQKYWAAAGRGAARAAARVRAASRTGRRIVTRAGSGEGRSRVAGRG